MSRNPWVALDATTDRKRHAKESIEAHRRAMSGGARPRSVRSVIGDSWDRSAAAGVSPGVRSAPVRLSREETAARLASGPLAFAPGVLARMREYVEGDDAQIALLCDTDGTILWIDGDPRVLDAAQDIHLSLGAEWSERAVGTNAMGTALAVDHPVQVFSGEHFAEPVHEWTCAAAPLHDPETGERIGVIDLSGGLGTAHPHTLALVSQAAAMIEALALDESRAADARLRERFGARVGRRRARALVSPRGRIVEAGTAGWVGRRVELSAGGTVAFEGRTYAAEPVDGGFLLMPRRSGGRSIRLSALGRDRASMEMGGRACELSPRHSELVLVLSMRPAGMTAEQLALAVWGEQAKPVNARAELSRLRRVLGTRLATAPYRLRGELCGDHLEVESLLRAGRLSEALDAYPGPLLPRSDVPLVAEARQILDDRVRDALLAHRDPALLERWLNHPSGERDTDACRALLDLLPEGDTRRAAARSHLRRMSAELAGQRMYPGPVRATPVSRDATWRAARTARPGPAQGTPSRPRASNRRK